MDGEIGKRGLKFHICFSFFVISENEAAASAQQLSTLLSGGCKKHSLHTLL